MSTSTTIEQGIYGWIDPLWTQAYQEPWNPYPPPDSVFPRGEKTREAALAYFGWELMNGTPVEELKKQPFWYYMEKGPKYAAQKKYR